MSDQLRKTGEQCVFWDCGDVKSPFVCDHVRAQGEHGICMPRKKPCELDEGKADCGMFLEK